MVLNHRYVIAQEWGEETRFWGEDDLRKSQIISEKVGIDEKIYLLGEHSGLYVLSGRLPAGRWSDNFGWYLEMEWVQKNIISRWFVDPPDFVLWRESKMGESELGEYQPKEITNWIKENYNKREMVWEGTYLWEKR